LKIGVLALQGDFLEHQHMLERLAVETCQVRKAVQLQDLDGLIIPGGESTVIGKLAQDFGMLDPLCEFGMRHAVWGTCAGSIFLSKDARREQPLLGLMDITVARNAFGRQVDSFETDLDVPVFKDLDVDNPPFHAIFIRAPLIDSIGAGVQVISALPDGRVVAARQGHWLATAFHPELTGDDRFHRYFLEIAKS
jgi:5'-phosphate synthase pdxT subunit